MRRTELEQRASVDALTGVLNRGRSEAEFVAALTAAQQSGAALAIVFIDVDHFKQVNDTHGHVVGDLCLVLVARRIRESLGADCLCGRYGGEEFLVIMPNATIGEACTLAERIRMHVSAEPVPAGDARVGVQVSIGVAQYSRGESGASLLNRADRALYEAKKKGRNCVVAATNPQPRMRGQERPLCIMQLARHHKKESFPMLGCSADPCRTGAGHAQNALVQGISCCNRQHRCNFRSGYELAPVRLRPGQQQL